MLLLEEVNLCVFIVCLTKCHYPLGVSSTECDFTHSFKWVCRCTKFSLLITLLTYSKTELKYAIWIVKSPCEALVSFSSPLLFKQLSKASSSQGGQPWRDSLWFIWFAGGEEWGEPAPHPEQDVLAACMFGAPAVTSQGMPCCRTLGAFRNEPGTRRFQAQ